MSMGLTLVTGGTLAVGVDPGAIPGYCDCDEVGLGGTLWNLWVWSGQSGCVSADNFYRFWIGDWLYAGYPPPGTVWCDGDFCVKHV